MGNDMDARGKCASAVAEYRSSGADAGRLSGRLLLPTAIAGHPCYCSRDAGRAWVRLAICMDMCVLDGIESSCCLDFCMPADSSY